MNETLTNFTQILHELNEKEFIFSIPSFTIFVVLMFFGVIGNVLVIYVFGYRLKKNIVQYFITLLSIFDLGSCLIAVPLCLIILRLPLLFPNDILCRFSGFLFYFMTIASGFTILIISIERYRKLCHPTERSLFKKTAYFTVGILISALLVASPTIIIYKRMPVNITNAISQAYTCMKIPVHEYKYYYGFLFLTVTSVSLSS